MNNDPCREVTITGKVRYLETKLKTGLEEVCPTAKYPPKKQWITETTLASITSQAALWQQARESGCKLKIWGWETDLRSYTASKKKDPEVTVTQLINQITAKMDQSDLQRWEKAQEAEIIWTRWNEMRATSRQLIKKDKIQYHDAMVKNAMEAKANGDMAAIWKIKAKISGKRTRKTTS